MKRDVLCMSGSQTIYYVFTLYRPHKYSNDLLLLLICLISVVKITDLLLIIF